MKNFFWLKQIQKNNKQGEGQMGVGIRSGGEGCKKIKKLISGGTSIRTLRV